MTAPRAATTMMFARTRAGSVLLAGAQPLPRHRQHLPHSLRTPTSLTSPSYTLVVATSSWGVQQIQQRSASSFSSFLFYDRDGTTRMTTTATTSSSQQQQQQQQQQQRRYKHSKRQIKRIFNQNPARIRAVNRERAARLGIHPKRDMERLDDDLVAKSVPPPPMFQPIVNDVTFLPNGWSRPPDPDVAVPTYPFTIERTGNKPNGAAGFLPVYTEYKHGRASVTTIIRRIRGDRELFIQELRSVLHRHKTEERDLMLKQWKEEAPFSIEAELEKRGIKKMRIPRKKPIEIKIKDRAGSVEVTGNCAWPVRYWLAGLGF